MGTWGVEAFENDTACDWILEATPGEVLRIVSAVPYGVSRVDDASAVAMAAVALAVAAQDPNEARLLSRSEREWLARHSAALTRIAPNAVRLALRCLRDPQLCDLD